jgi:hypothetical protein
VHRTESSIPHIELSPRRRPPHLTGTSRSTTLTTSTMDKKMVLVQKDTDANDVMPSILIAVVCDTPKGQESVPMLLSAVAQQAER